MNINSIMSAANATGSSNQTNSSAAPAQSGAEKNMFLTLLVAQLKNQDPLAPQDGAQFVAQLAQFNSLDQLIGIRNSIEQLTTLLNRADKPAA